MTIAVDLGRKATKQTNIGVKVTQNVAQYLLHNMTFENVKFKVAMSNG